MPWNHGVRLVLSAAVLIPAAMASAAEDELRGVSLVRVVSDAAGHRFEVTVTPPPDRAVDPRFMDDLEISQTSPAGGPAASGAVGAEGLVLAGPGGQESADVDEAPIDVSGYRVTVEPLSVSGCSGQYTIVKGKPANLNPKSYYYVDVKGAAAMVVTAYPTSGDVDAQILINNTTQCAISKKGKGNLDVATCYNSLCNTQQDTLRGAIVNSTSSTAKFVGMVAAFLSN